MKIQYIQQKKIKPFAPEQPRMMLGEDLKSEESKSEESDNNISSDTFETFTKEEKRRTHHIYLSETIDSAYEYRKLCHFLRTSEEIEEVYIYLANYGGYVHTGLQLINAIRDSKSKITMVVDTACYSMGAILALAGDDVIFNPNSMLMFHNYSGFERGKGKEMFDAAVSTTKWLQSAFKQICSPFLTDKEMEMIRNDHDVYIYHSDKNLQARVNRHFKRSKKYE